MRGRHRQKKLARVTRQHPPVVADLTDEASSDPTLRAFRDALLDIVRRRDWAALAEASHEDVQWDAQERGRDGLVEAIQAFPYIWESLEEALAAGGAFDGAGAFVSPPLMLRWPPGRWPDFNIALAQGRDVYLYADPEATLVVRELLAGELVSLLPTVTDAVCQVETMNGQVGYAVARRLLASEPMGFRVELTKRGGAWGMSFASSPMSW